MDSNFRFSSFMEKVAIRKWSRNYFWILAGVSLLYLGTFPFLRIPALIAIPSIIAGWFYYKRGGFIAGVAVFFVNLFLIDKFHVFEPNQLFQLSNGILAGHFFILLTSFGVGYLRREIEKLYLVQTKLLFRDRHLTLVNMATRTILESRDPADLYFRLLLILENLFVADYAYLTLWDPALQQVTLVASTRNPNQPLLGNVLDSEDAATTRFVLDSGQVLFIEDAQNSPYMVNPAPFREFQQITKSAIVVPLATREHKLGTVILVFDEAQHFNREEISYFELTGAQITLALNSILQERKIEKQLKESQILSAIERALSESEKVGLNLVLQLIVDSAKELIPNATNVVLHLLDPEQQILTPRATTAMDDTGDGARTPLKMRLGEGVAGQVMESGQPIAISDVRTDSRYLHQSLPVSYRSLIVAPVQINDRRLGTISVHRQGVGAFHPDEISLLTSLGIRAAIAIENAHMLEDIQYALKETNALYLVNQKLLAVLDPQELMQDVVEFLSETFEYSYVQIFVADSATGDFVMRAGSGEIGRQLRQQEYRLRAGEGIVGYTAETGNPFFTNNADKVVTFVRNPFLPEIQSKLTVPVRVEGHILGLLDIQQLPPRQLTQRDLQLVSAVADQLALALQKANLYADLQSSLQMEKSMRNQLLLADRLSTMGRLLASVSHELNNPLQAIQNALFLLREEQGLSEQGRQDLDIVLSESERMAALLARLRATYRPAHTEAFHLMQVNDIVEDVHALVATHLRHNQISFEFHPDPSLPQVPGLPHQIRQVVLNLLMNAVEAMTEGGRLMVSTAYFDQAQEVLLRVADTGPGIDPSILSTIFDPFVTSKDYGTGLGLTISYDIIHKHHGRIQAGNDPEGGAVFNIWLPTQEKQA